MPKIFISYARADATELAEELADRLRAMEYDVFLDKHTMVGTIDWEKEIKARARWCDVMLMLVTPAANQSGWVYREFEFARAANRKILPVIVDQTPLPVHLGMYQAVKYGNNDIASVLLEIARIAPPPPPIPPQAGCSRVSVSFGVITTVISLMLAFLAIVPEEPRERIFCAVWKTENCPTEIVTLPTNTPEPMITDEPTPVSSMPTEPSPTPILPTSTPSLTPIPPTPMPTNTIEPTPTPIPIYEEDFEDGIAQDWLDNDVWLVGRNNEANTYFYKSTGFTGYSRTILNSNRNFENISVQFRVRISTYLHIYFCRPTPSANYVLNIDRSNNYISLYDYERSGSEPRSQPFIFEDSEWHDVRIEIRGQQVTSTVDEVTLVPYIVSNCYNGNILLGLGSENAAFVDDIRVWSLDN
jgi:hypothetical protein